MTTSSSSKFYVCSAVPHTHIHTHMFVQNRHTHSHTHTHTPTRARALFPTPFFIAHLLSRTIFTDSSRTVPSCTISFVYASFPCALHLLFHLWCIFYIFFSRATLSHPSFTHIFVTHHLSHTTLIHTTLHMQPFHSSIIHHLPCLSCLAHPSGTLCFFLLYSFAHRRCPSGWGHSWLPSWRLCVGSTSLNRVGTVGRLRAQSSGDRPKV